MPTLYRGQNFKITMYAEDHNPPHFHVLTPEFAEVISIENLETLGGRVPLRIRRKACEWAAQNQPLLFETWEALRKKG